jgi:hypothetical protein
MSMHTTLDLARLALRAEGRHNDEAKITTLEDQLSELIIAIAQYRADYRSEGCADPNCHVCARSAAATKRLNDALAALA